MNKYIIFILTTGLLITGCGNFKPTQQETSSPYNDDTISEDAMRHEAQEKLLKD